LNTLTIDVNLAEKESLISTNRAREDSITTELKETMQSPPNTDNELGKFFTEEERLHAVDDTNKNVKERLERGIQHRHMGNSYFKKNKFKESLNEYLSAVEEMNGLLLLKTQSSLNVANIDWLRLECINNISVCYLLLKEYNKVLYYTEQVLAVNPNNVNSLSYRAKALIALKLYREASECIKKALSIKYSKRLMALLKQIEENINFGGKDLLDFEKDANEQNLIEFKKSSLFINQEIDAKTGLVSTSSMESESNVKKSEIKQPFTRSFLFSFLFTIFKFSKILSIGLIEFLKRHKYGILILIVIWIITFRTSFKNKLLNLILRIRFN
jgi:tetratricopeptide (TPR) repeat protein